MKYYIDTEFLEGTQKEKCPISLFRKNSPPTIDLISIGIVAEDGREYYAISKDFNLKEAWNRFDWKEHKSIHKEDEGKKLVQKVYWIRENVLKPIFMELTTENILDGMDFSYKNMKFLINQYGKTNKEIAEEIKEFVLFGKTEKVGDVKYTSQISTNPEFYAYYADYDWVAFCWIFGKMMNLPKDFPMYCKDLKQLIDEKAYNIVKGLCFGNTKQQEEKMAINSIPGQVEALKNNPNYPKQENEHLAIHDARWNKKLHEFLNQL